MINRLLAEQFSPSIVFLEYLPNSRPNLSSTHNSLKFLRPDSSGNHVIILRWRRNISVLLKTGVIIISIVKQSLASSFSFATYPSLFPDNTIATNRIRCSVLSICFRILFDGFQYKRKPNFLVVLIKIEVADTC